MAESGEPKKRIVVVARKHGKCKTKKGKSCNNRKCQKILALNDDVVLLTLAVLPGNDEFDVLVTCNDDCADEAEHQLQLDNDQESGIEDE